MKTIPGFFRIALTSLPLLVAGIAGAVPITGAINIVSFADNAFSFDTTANTVTFGSGNNALVSNVSGSFAGLLAAPVHYNSFTYTPFVGPIIPLWITTGGAPASSFNLTSITFIDEIPGISLTVVGNGLIKVAGRDDTAGTWSFTATQNGTAFGWDSINVPRVPDGGATLVLLGLSVLGLGGVNRFLPLLKK